MTRTSPITKSRTNTLSKVTGILHRTFISFLITSKSVTSTTIYRNIFSLEYTFSKFFTTSLKSYRETLSWKWKIQRTFFILIKSKFESLITIPSFLIFTKRLMSFLTSSCPLPLKKSRTFIIKWRKTPLFK